MALSFTTYGNYKKVSYFEVVMSRLRVSFIGVGADVLTFYQH